MNTSTPSQVDLPNRLPADFLAKPSPDLTATRIDFSKTALPRYAGAYAVILDNVLTHAECRTLLHAAEATQAGKTEKWERAMVNIGQGQQAMITDVRNCGRIIWDSRDVVGRIWKRLEHVPQVREIASLEQKPEITGAGPSKRGEVWRMTRPNERMRFLKYVGGEYFRPHCDGMYITPDGEERSYLTMHLYLNDTGEPSEESLVGLTEADRKEAEENVLEGGATTFHNLTWDDEPRLDVEPKAGRVLLFQHRNLVHSGDDVRAGVKYTMRTDIMYSLAKDGEVTP